jgi:hypothetical protein
LLALIALSSGCAVKAAQLKDLSLPPRTEVVSSSKQSDARVLIGEFQDLRGENYARVSPTTVIPVVDFFHIGITAYYPESNGSIWTTEGGRRTVMVGSIPQAFPHVLAREIREAKVTPHATPSEDLNVTSESSQFDYRLSGQLRRTSVTSDFNPFPGAVLALFGAPYGVGTFRMEVTTELTRIGGDVVAEHTYEVRDALLVGLYYNLDYGHRGFVNGLEEVTDAIIVDLAADLADDHGAGPGPKAAVGD